MGRILEFFKLRRFRKIGKKAEKIPSKEVFTKSFCNMIGMGKSEEVSKQIITMRNFDVMKKEKLDDIIHETFECLFRDGKYDEIKKITEFLEDKYPLDKERLKEQWKEWVPTYV